MKSNTYFGLSLARDFELNAQFSGIISTKNFHKLNLTPRRIYYRLMINEIEVATYMSHLIEQSTLQ